MSNIAAGRRTDAPGAPGAGAGDTPIVEARELYRHFGDAEGRTLRVLRGVDLAVHPGESMAIVGPSGAGKSTLLHLLGALDRPTSGEVSLGGTPVSDLDDRAAARVRNRLVGFVFQFHHLLRDFSALENVIVPQLVRGVTREAARDRARALLDQVGLSERTGHRPTRLSGGEQQRVAVARALANEPPLLLADEPSGNLDFEASERLHDLLFDLVDRHGTAMVVVTHNQELAARAERIMELRGGRLRPVEPGELVRR